MPRLCTFTLPLPESGQRLLPHGLHCKGLLSGTLSFHPSLEIEMVKTFCFWTLLKIVVEKIEGWDMYILLKMKGLIKKICNRQTLIVGLFPIALIKAANTKRVLVKYLSHSTHPVYKQHRFYRRSLWRPNLCTSWWGLPPIADQNPAWSLNIIVQYTVRLVKVRLLPKWDWVLNSSIANILRWFLFFLTSSESHIIYRSGHVV